MGVSGQAMIEALIAGESSPQVLAALARGSLKKKLPDLQAALLGRVDRHHRLLLTHLMAHIHFLEHTLPRDAQRAGESGEDGLSCGFEDVLLLLIRNGQARLTELQRNQRGRLEETAKPSHAQAIRRPRAVAKASGIPKRLIETSGAVFGRALRARRSAQERRW